MEFITCYRFIVFARLLHKSQSAFPITSTAKQRHFNNENRCERWAKERERKKNIGKVRKMRTNNIIDIDTKSCYGAIDTMNYFFTLHQLHPTRPLPFPNTIHVIWGIWHIIRNNSFFIPDFVTFRTCVRSHVKSNEHIDVSNIYEHSHIHLYRYLSLSLTGALSRSCIL